MRYRDRHFAVGRYFHLYNRGVNRQNIFFEHENYLFFLRQCRLYLMPKMQILAYCLMPNHYHFLVQVNADDLSEQMKRLSLSYTKAINRRLKRCGPLFQGRFQSIHVEGEEYLLNLSRYIHLNPVQAGLVQKSEDWEFSSYREYVELRPGTLPQWEPIRRQVGNAQSYRQFVESCDRTPPKMRHLLHDE